MGLGDAIFGWDPYYGESILYISPNPLPFPNALALEWTNKILGLKIAHAPPHVLNHLSISSIPQSDCAATMLNGTGPTLPRMVESAHHRTWKEWATFERTYRIDSAGGTFTKTEILFNTNIHGEPTTPWKSTARLRNEYSTLKFIREHTTIPVPQPLCTGEVDGCHYVVMEHIHGVALDDLPKDIRAGAVERAIKFIEDLVLPQLRNLKSDRNGSLDGQIIPPRRVVERYKGVEWFPQKAPTKKFQFCHNDLGQHNILCDRQTGDVISIIDWEYAGYYEQPFEGLLWRKPHHELTHDEQEIDDLARCLGDPVAGIRPTVTSK